MFHNFKNNNMEKLIKCVDRSDELSTWKEVDSKLEEIMKEKSGYSKRQVIEAQIASLESVISSPFGAELSIACMLIASAIALLGNLTTIKSLQDKMIIFDSSASLLILVCTVCMLTLNMFFHPRRKSKIILYKILLYMLENEKEKEKKEEMLILQTIPFQKRRIWMIESLKGGDIW